MPYVESYDEAFNSAVADLVRLSDNQAKPVAIKFDGQFIVLRSGKGTWRSERDAKLALRGELEWVHFKPDPYDTGKVWYNKFVKDMVAGGRLEFVVIS